MSNIPHQKIRRADRAVEDEAWIAEFLHRAPAGVLATTRADQPFLNPNIFVYDEELACLYFHTARDGNTRRCVVANPRASFAVYEMGRLLPADEALEFSVEYASVVVFGAMSIVEGLAESRRGMQLMLSKYFPRLVAGRDYRAIQDHELRRTTVFRLQIESWSAKRKQAAADFPGAFSFSSDRPGGGALLSG